MSYKINYIVVLSVISILFFSFATNASAISISDNIMVATDDCGFDADGTCNCTCDGTTAFGDDDNCACPAYWLAFIMNVIKYIAIIALIVLVILDFFKAMVSNDKEATKTAGIKAVKRFIYCVIIFFLPILIKFVLDLFGVYKYTGIGGV